MLHLAVCQSLTEDYFASKPADIIKDLSGFRSLDVCLNMNQRLFAKSIIKSYFSEDRSFQCFFSPNFIPHKSIHTSNVVTSVDFDSSTLNLSMSGSSQYYIAQNIMTGTEFLSKLPIYLQIIDDYVLSLGDYLKVSNSAGSPPTW